MKQYKNTAQTIQNTVNTSTHVTKTPTHTHTHILHNKLKQTVQDTHQMKLATLQSSTLSIRSP